MTDPEVRLFINGQFVPSLSGKMFEVYNPFNEKVVANVYEAEEEDVNRAVEAAKSALPTWSKLNAIDRADYLYKLAELLEHHNQDFGKLDAVLHGQNPLGVIVIHIVFEKLN